MVPIFSGLLPSVISELPRILGPTALKSISRSLRSSLLKIPRRVRRKKFVCSAEGGDRPFQGVERDFGRYSEWILNTAPTIYEVIRWANSVYEHLEKAYCMTNVLGVRFFSITVCRFVDFGSDLCLTALWEFALAFDITAVFSKDLRTRTHSLSMQCC
ncbi:hypothetical protein BC835DRAFT_1342920 [Cytidiella melzeri]|nr:hypothetical protein BC835DRAFT_1342920 [Cytidiella melzeri]